MRGTHLDHIAVFAKMINAVDQIISFFRNIDLNDDRCTQFNVFKIESEREVVSVHHFKAIAKRMICQIEPIEIRYIPDLHIIGIAEIPEDIHI